MARATVVSAWTVAMLAFATSLVAVVNAPQGYDTAPLTKAVHAFVHGGHPYTGAGAGGFLYPPAALLVLLPLAAFGVAWAGRLFFVVDVVSILLASAILLQLFGLRVRGFAGAVVLFGISLAWPVIFTLEAGNVNGPILLGFACFLWAATRRSWTTAGTVLGFTLAVKPILAPVLLVVALYRRWHAFAVAVVIPLVLSASVLIAVPSTRSFFHTTLPLLVHGQNSRIQRSSVSLWSAAARLSIPTPAIRFAQAAVILVTLALLWRRWRADAYEPRRLVELTTIALVGGFLVSSFAFEHYGIFLMPFVISLLADRTSPHRHWLTVGALFCIAARQGWVLNRLPSRVNDVIAQRFTFALLALLVAFWLATRREAKRPPVPMATSSGFERVEPEPSVRLGVETSPR
jgi:arabinofuranan 3-O-arabinosyltransferase